MHIANNFSREYFIERIEHALEKFVTTSIYSYLSLGPGQHFGSKGCYIARSFDTPTALAPASNWIVP